MIKQDIEPGRVVELDGELFLIEDVVVEVILQRIDSHREAIERAFDGQITEVGAPVFHRIRGKIGEGQFAEDRFKPLYREDEL